MKRLFSGLAVAFVLVARAHGECLDTGIRELVQVRGESCSSARAVLQERVEAQWDRCSWQLKGVEPADVRWHTAGLVDNLLNSNRAVAEVEIVRSCRVQASTFEGRPRLEGCVERSEREPWPVTVLLEACPDWEASADTWFVIETPCSCVMCSTASEFVGPELRIAPAELASAAAGAG